VHSVAPVAHQRRHVLRRRLPRAWLRQNLVAGDALVARVPRRHPPPHGEKAASQRRRAPQVVTLEVVIRDVVRTRRENDPEARRRRLCDEPVQDCHARGIEVALTRVLRSALHPLLRVLIVPVQADQPDDVRRRHCPPQPGNVVCRRRELVVVVQPHIDSGEDEGLRRPSGWEATARRDEARAARRQPQRA